MWCFVMHTRFKQVKGGNPRHNFVWAKSVSQVPGHEMELVTVGEYVGRVQFAEKD